MSRNGRRVVVTGMGVVTPLGIGIDPYWEAIRQGRSGVKRIESFQVDDIATRFAATVDDFVPESFIPRKDARRMDRSTQMAVAAAKLAIADSGLGEGSYDPYDIGVSVGTGIGGMHSFEAEHSAYRDGGPRRISPFAAPMMIPSMPAGQISIQIGLHGPTRCLATACATGTDCIGEGFELVRRGTVPMMLAGGVEATITRFVIAVFSNCKVLSRRNDDPEAACRPYDRDRDGFVMGEGAGIVLLEDREHALARGARVYAEVIGYGATADAYHMTQPHPSGQPMSRAMQAALREANLPTDAIDYINAHGTSTQLNDKFETLAIKETFGAHAYRVPINSTKSMTGHLIGAAGAVEFVTTALSIRDGYIHPTINLDNPDPECDLDYVPKVGRCREIRYAMSNSLAFGGHNASLVLAHPDELSR